MEQETTTARTFEDAPVEHARRCPSCGGLNPSAAQWCGQCHSRFDVPPAPPPAHVEEAAAETSDAAEPATEIATTRNERAAAVDPASTFLVTDEGINWTCSTCETVNDLDVSICAVCGAPFGRTVLPPEQGPQRDPNMTAMISLFMPGAGHAYLGMWGQAIARGVISLWVFMVVLVAALQKGAASSNLVMVVFGTVTFVLWGVTAHDAYREARDEKTLVILKGRMFFYMVLGLLLLLVSLLMMSMVKVQSS
jgi:hypothetical protein